MSAVLRSITIYPIKSLDGLDVADVQVLANGALENDRRFALVDADGRYVNGKRTAAIHRVRAEYDLRQMTVRLNDEVEFALIQEQREISAWLSTLLGITCTIKENSAGGFPDDTLAPGPTLVSTATLAEVASWFPTLTLAEARRRFRANLEIDGVEPFWEDRLVGPRGCDVPFRIGTICWLGLNPCQRCVVPSRDTESGETTPGFQQVFATSRESRLPAWASRDRFDHFYRLAVNTRLATGASPARTRVGETVTVG